MSDKIKKFERNVARQLLAKCLYDFCHDDCLYDEQVDIAEALVDIEFPRTKTEYRKFCKLVLCWIPGEDEE